MEKHYNFGILGFGFMGRVHLYSVENLKFFTLPDSLGATASVHGICNSRHENAMSAAKQYCIPKAFASAEELISSPDIDIVDISTPNSDHIEALRLALKYKKHVICEKPLTATVEEATEAVALAKEAERLGLVWGCVFNNRHLAPIVRARQLIDDKAIGDIVSFDFKYYHDSCIDPTRTKGWKQDATYGGGTLADLGPHIIDLCHMLVGRLENLSARSQIAFDKHLTRDGGVWDTNADEAFYINAKAQCGAVGSINVSKVAVGTCDGLSFEIYGTKGALKFDLMSPSWLYYYDATKDTTPVGGMRGWVQLECAGRYPEPASTFPSLKSSVGWLRGHVMSMANYVCALSHGEKFMPTIYDGADVMSVMAAAYASDKNSSALTDVKYLD